MMAEYDDIDTRMVAVVGVISIAALVGVVIGIQALYYKNELDEEQRKLIAVEELDAKNLLAEQEAKLNRAGWLDRASGRIAIPIDRAMQLVVEELNFNGSSADRLKPNATNTKGAQGSEGAEKTDRDVPEGEL